MKNQAANRLKNNTIREGTGSTGGSGGLNPIQAIMEFFGIG